LEKRIKGLARSIRKDQIEQTHQRTKRKINKKYTTKEGKKNMRSLSFGRIGSHFKLKSVIGLINST
jgi:hypothetical protein